MSGSVQWVVATKDCKALIERFIPQMMTDLEGSEYYDREGNKCGWRELLAHRCELYRPKANKNSYLRRINAIMKLDFHALDASIADAICLSLGCNIEDEMETYAHTRAAARERIEIEAEFSGKKYKPEQIEAKADMLYKKHHRKLHPPGQKQTAFQVADNERRRARMAAKRAQAA